MSSYGLERGEAEGGIVAVVLSGDLDLTNAPELEQRLESAAPPEARLVLDLNRVSFIDSAALHVLFRLARRRGREGLAVLVEPTAQVAATLAIVGLDRAVTVRATLVPSGAPADGS